MIGLENKHAFFAFFELTQHICYKKSAPRGEEFSAIKPDGSFLQPQVKITAILRSSRSRIVWIARPRKDGRVNRVSWMRKRKNEGMGMIHMQLNKKSICGGRIQMKLLWFLITCVASVPHIMHPFWPARCSLSCSRARKDSIKHTRFHGIDRLVVKLWALDLLHGRRNALEVC